MCHKRELQALKAPVARGSLGKNLKSGPLSVHVLPAFWSKKKNECLNRTQTSLNLDFVRSNLYRKDSILRWQVHVK